MNAVPGQIAPLNRLAQWALDEAIAEVTVLTDCYVKQLEGIHLRAQFLASRNTTPPAASAPQVAHYVADKLTVPCARCGSLCRSMHTYSY
ncbi:protein of unknown function [Caballeronia sp. S22]